MSIYNSKSEIEHFSRKSDIGVNAWIWNAFIKKSLEDYGPYRLLVTISFQRILSPQQTIEFGKQLVMDAIKALTGKRAKQRRKHLPVDGVAVLEMARLYKKAKKEGGHLHILLKEHPRLPGEDEDAIAFLKKTFNDAAARLKLTNLCKGRLKIVEGTRLVNPEVGVNVRDIYDQAGIAGYLSKQVFKADWDILERFFYLHASEGLSIWKPRASVEAARF